MDFFPGAHPLILYPFWVMLSPISQIMVSLMLKRERGMAAIVASDDNEIKKKILSLPLPLPMMRERVKSVLDSCDNL
jgi:hypothetical protein